MFLLGTIFAEQGIKAHGVLIGVKQWYLHVRHYKSISASLWSEGCFADQNSHACQPWCDIEVQTFTQSFPNNKISSIYQLQTYHLWHHQNTQSIHFDFGNRLQSVRKNRTSMCIHAICTIRGLIQNKPNCVNARLFMLFLFKALPTVIHSFV